MIPISGNSQGTIILFEPTTSEHISARTIDQIAVTALAPSGDCRTFAIGCVSWHDPAYYYTGLTTSFFAQIPKWPVLDCYPSAEVYDPP